jgi:hypothetical protein
MPLLEGNSPAIRSANISELRKAGYKENQAVAIAYSKSRRGKKKPKKHESKAEESAEGE